MSETNNTQPDQESAQTFAYGSYDNQVTVEQLAEHMKND